MKTNLNGRLRPVVQRQYTPIVVDQFDTNAVSKKAIEAQKSKHKFHIYFSYFCFFFSFPYLTSRFVVHRIWVRIVWKALYCKSFASHLTNIKLVAFLLLKATNLLHRRADSCQCQRSNCARISFIRTHARFFATRSWTLPGSPNGSAAPSSTASSSHLRTRARPRASSSAGVTNACSAPRASSAAHIAAAW